MLFISIEINTERYQCFRYANPRLLDTHVILHVMLHVSTIIFFKINNSNYQLNCISLVALLQLSVLTIGGCTFFVDLQVRNNFLWQKRTLLIKKKLTMGKVSTQKYNPGHSLFVVTPAGLTFKILSSRSENEVVLLMDDHIVYRNNKHNHFPVYLSVIDFFFL